MNALLSGFGNVELELESQPLGERDESVQNKPPGSPNYLFREEKVNAPVDGILVLLNSIKYLVKYFRTGKLSQSKRIINQLNGEE